MQEELVQPGNDNPDLGILASEPEGPWCELVCVLRRNGSLWGLVSWTVTQTERMMVYSEEGRQPCL